MKSKLPFVFVALITASLAYAAISYAGGAKSAAASDCADCCEVAPEAAK